MWLIHTTNLQLSSFQGKHPPYAILSHRWGDDDDEVSFQQWRGDHAKIAHKPGYVKINKACEQARTDGLEYLWVDTCCIDKSSSAELSEAINSMFRFYSKAKVCYAYLQDVHGTSTRANNSTTFRRSNWFTRGWTLQELMAPKDVVFFTSTWETIGDKENLVDEISTITGIPAHSLWHPGSIRFERIATRMSWVANRVTTRIEDIAYCMLGILDINMPLLYGEGRRAFQRLQEELVKASEDMSIFAWDWLPRFKRTGRGHFGNELPQLRAEYLIDIGWDVQPMYISDEMDFDRYKEAEDISSGATSMFAPDPVFFYSSARFYCSDLSGVDMSTPYFITNKGLSISLPAQNMITRKPGAISSSQVGKEQPPLVNLSLGDNPFIRGATTGVALFLTPSRDRLITYSRCFGLDEHGALLPDKVFRGHLLSFTMPFPIFRDSFQMTPMLVRATYGCQSLFAWDQAPEFEVVVLNGTKGNFDIDIAEAGMAPKSTPVAPSLTSRSGAEPANMRTKNEVQLRKGTECYGAIYRVVRRYTMENSNKVDFEFHVLVRATAKGNRTGSTIDEGGVEDEDSVEDNDSVGDEGSVANSWSIVKDPAYWRCELITEASTEANPPQASSHDHRYWMMGDRALTLSQILDLPMQGDDNGRIEQRSFVRLTRETEEHGKRLTLTIRVSLEGQAHWVTNPASSVKFLHATEAKTESIGNRHRWAWNLKSRDRPTSKS
ncbi:heterokaryon incompatibility protein-domain-containing protein [Podospora conica]|nr:heterokaryon incompatibility protein-domain-containing protein [Schizothecium conicum]